MVLDIIDYIGKELLKTNAYLEAFAANCIKLKGGEIVNFIGEEKQNFAPSDIVGIAAYVRLDPNITYTPVTQKKFSCDDNVLASMKFRLILFQIGRTPKLHPGKVENKISADLSNINFNAFTGSESQIKISVNSSNLNFYDNFVAEVGKDYTIPTDSIIIAINCTLSWETSKDDCENNCYIYEDPELCAPCTSSNVVTIYDQDKNVLEQFTDGGEYTVTVFSGVRDRVINGNQTTILDSII